MKAEGEMDPAGTAIVSQPLPCKNAVQTPAADVNEGGISSMIPTTLRDYFFYDPAFENCWPTYENIHQELLKDSQLLWSKVKQTTEAANAAIPYDKIADGAHNLSAMVFPRQWMFPRFMSKEDCDKVFPLDFSHFQRENKHLVNVKDDASMLEISMDIHDYKPEEIKVHVMDHKLVLEAKHEKKGEGHYVVRQFSRQFELPEGCDVGMVQSNLSSDGILVVTAPKKAINGDILVPIEMAKKK